jgi:hypothetical protein
MFFSSMAGVIGGNDNSQRLSADFINETVDKLKSSSNGSSVTVSTLGIAANWQKCQVC